MNPLQRFLRAMLVCLGLGPAVAGAAADQWNCERGADGKEWVCSAKPPKSGTAAAPPGEQPRPVEPSRETATTPTEPKPRGAESPAPARPRTQPEEPPAAARPEPIPPPASQTPRPERRQATAPTPEHETPSRRVRIPETREAESAHESTPRPAATEKPGWTCRPAEAGKEWNCALVGPEPGGMEHEVTETEERGENWAESSTFTRQDEQRFGRIISLLPANPWTNACAIGNYSNSPMTEFMMTPREKAARETAPLHTQSDYFEMLENEIATFTGTAELTKADQKLWGDFVVHNTVTDTLNARGNVVYQEKGMSVSADSGFLNLETHRGVFRNSQFVLSTTPSRGTSRLTYFDDAARSRYKSFTYTSCPPGNADWLMHANNVRIDKDTGRGTATNAWFEFKGIPAFYLPYMTFPVDHRRQSGLLSPMFTTSRINGFDFSVPYYLNLAPNYDATIWPRFLANRGVLVHGEFRYLTPMTRGQIIAEYLPHDDQSAKNNQNPNNVREPTARGKASFVNFTTFSQNLTGHIDANYMSDASYGSQLGHPLTTFDSRYVQSQGDLTYAGSGYVFRTMASYYQTVDPTIAKKNRPYYQLPQALFSYGHALGNTGLMFEGSAQLDNFAHDSPDKVTGQRLNIKPRIYYPFQSAAGYITPSLTLLYTQYQLQNAQKWSYWSGNEHTVIDGTHSSLSRTLPLFSVDSGAFFDREFEFGKKPMLQTLEPRLFYVYIPYANQRQIPRFDSQEYDFTVYQFFRENRFTGYDRIGDANQITAALTTRLVDQTSGIERLRATIGELFYFRQRHVLLDETNGTIYNKYNIQTRNQDTSNLIGDVNTMITNTWSIHGAGQWNPSRNQIDRGQLELQYNDHHNQVFNIAYRFRRNPQNLRCLKGTHPNTEITFISDPKLVQDINFNDPAYACLDLTDVSFRLPVATGWYAIGRWQYSLQDQLTLDSFLGIERETCCWRLTLLGRHYINSISAQNNQPQTNNAFFVQLELKGLTRLGDEVDKFLERSVGGFRYYDLY